MPSVIYSPSTGGRLSVIFFLLFIAAVVGIFRPYIKNVKRKHFALAAVVSFFLIGVFAPTDEVQTDNKDVADDTANSGNGTTPQTQRGPTEPKSKWEYSHSRDEMRGTTTRLASLASENEVNLEFPYGKVRGHLWIRHRPEDGLNVAFEVDKGQVLCRSFSNGHLSVKFDDGPIQKFRCVGSSDGSSETAFLEGEQRALAALKKATRTIVEAEFYQQGRQQFIFETAGLQWE